MVARAAAATPAEVDAALAAAERGAHGSPAQLEQRLVLERGEGHGAGAPTGGASSFSSSVPPACAWRNDSLLVFSSSRLTR